MFRHGRRRNENGQARNDISRRVIKINMPYLRDYTLSDLICVSSECEVPLHTAPDPTRPVVGLIKLSTDIPV